MTTSVALLFPGQGAQVAGMGRDLAAVFPEARHAFEEADEALGFSLTRLCFEGSDSDIRPTEIAQPALLTCSIAALRCITEQNIHPTAAAGHSLGEYTALVAAGALSFADGVRLVRRRGQLMAEAGVASPGAMAAVLGLDGATVTNVCELVLRETGEIVVPANFNAPGQVVISGTSEGVNAASTRLKLAGASRVIPLAVSGAFHSPLMTAAARGMEAELVRTAFSPAEIPVIANTTAAPVVSPEEIRTALVCQMASGVRWDESIRSLRDMGVTHYLELGSGKVLSGLARKILPGASAYSINDSVGVANLAAFLDTAS